MRGQLGAGAVVSTAISVAGWRARALSGRGAVAATGVGTAIAVGASWPGMVVLGTFFVSSSALSRTQRHGGVAAKGSRRDEWQVLANGAVAAVSALAGGRVDRAFGLSLSAGALAAAAADTWATELGASSRTTPRLILSGRAVPRGTSGGVTSRGSLAALGGAATLGAIAGIVIGSTSGWQRGVRIGPGIVVAGLAGSLVDSVLGELVQERRNCPACNVATEARIHDCGTPTVHSGGVRGFDNDLVNLVCTMAGCLAIVPFAYGTCD
ncbi:MAG: DUF92 domain-containing protein [Chloroflexota bacterium]|nr:DUF92 domain-containing protein [Chloroflexota bacterium]